MRTLRVHGSWAGLLVLALAAAAPAPAQQAPVIQMAASSNDSTTAAVYAVKAGLFKAAGLNVQPTPLSSGSAVAAAVAGGAVRSAGHALSLIQRVRRDPFILVAGSAILMMPMQTMQWSCARTLP